MVTARTFLVRGLLAGLLAGIIGFGVGYVIGEPSVDAAIAVESGGDQSSETAHSHQDNTSDHTGATDEIVSRPVQSTWGLATATIVFGTALGGVIGLVAAVGYGRLGRFGVRGSTALVALFGFVSVQLLPWVVYPPNPPAVGDPSTIGRRTAEYFGLVAISVVAAVAAVVLFRRLAAALGGWNSAVVAAVGYLVVVCLTGWLLPGPEPVPDGFPAGTLWDFRIASLGLQAVIWTVITVVLGALLHRVVSRAAAARLPVGSGR